MARYRRPVAPGLFWLRTEGFPRRWREASRRGARVWLGIGGNLEDPPRRFLRLVRWMERQRDLHPVECSPILINPPFGYRDQPEFYNAVLLLRTPLGPRALLRRMLEAERRFGRRRSFPNAPRTLDLDLLFYEGRRIGRPELKIPHPHWRERPSVILPLAEMDELPPRLRRTALQRWGR